MSREFPQIEPPSAPESTPDTPPSVRKPGISIPLVLSGIGLWGTLIYGVAGLFMLHDGGGYGAGLLFFAGLLYVGIPTCVAAIFFLSIYAVIEKPWREGARTSMAFNAQIPIAGLAVVCIGIAAYGQYQDDRQSAREDRQNAQYADATQRMKIALKSDDLAGFSSALAKCGDYDCDDSAGRGEWISRAVQANAPRIVALMLKGLTAEAYRNQNIDNVIPLFCKGGTLYYFPDSLATLVGFRDNPAITEQFLPLWGAQDRDRAFYGATMAGSVRLMDRLVKQGVDPRNARGDGVDDNPFAAAARGGATVSVRWLIDAGVRMRTTGEEDAMWYALADWAAYAPPDLADKRIDAWLQWIRFNPKDPGSHVVPLQVAVDRNSPVFAQVLLRHGWRAQELPSESRARLQDLISRPVVESRGQTLRQSACAAGDWTLAEGVTL